MRVNLSPEYSPAILKGIKINPKNPLKFDFILDQGDTQQEQLSANSGKEESMKLIKYFLASVTVPEKDLWVNLSPYEKDRIVPEAFGQTEMGRDLLAEDYLLKQITASLMHPEDEIGKKFWNRIYAEAAKRFSNTNIPVNTFNKVWIVPQKALVYENSKAGTAYVIESKLKVMLESDYLAEEKNPREPGDIVSLGALNAPIESVSPSRLPSDQLLNVKTSQGNNVMRHQVSQVNWQKQIIREIIIPELEKEVNQGKNFAQLRQVYNSLILATWYKKKIKQSILARVYADKNKVKGTEYQESVINNNRQPGDMVSLGALKRQLSPCPHAGCQASNSLNMEAAQVNSQNDVEAIYQNYLQAFKKGAVDLIKEERDDITKQIVARKYFSGGIKYTLLAAKELEINEIGDSDLAMITRREMFKKLTLVTAGLVLQNAIAQDGQRKSYQQMMDEKVLMVLGKETVEDLKDKRIYNGYVVKLENVLTSHSVEDIEKVVREFNGPFSMRVALALFTMNIKDIMSMRMLMKDVFDALDINFQSNVEARDMFIVEYADIKDKELLREMVFKWKEIYKGQIIDNLKKYTAELVDQKPTLSQEKKQASTYHQEKIWEDYFIKSGVLALMYFNNRTPLSKDGLLDIFLSLFTDTSIESGVKAKNASGFTFYAGLKKVSAEVFIGLVAHEVGHFYFYPRHGSATLMNFPVRQELFADIGALSFMSEMMNKQAVNGFVKDFFPLGSGGLSSESKVRVHPSQKVEQHYVARTFLRPLMGIEVQWNSLLEAVADLTNPLRQANLPKDILEDINGPLQFNLKDVREGEGAIFIYNDVAVLQYLVSKIKLPTNQRISMNKANVYITHTSLKVFMRLMNAEKISLEKLPEFIAKAKATYAKLLEQKYNVVNVYAVPAIEVDVDKAMNSEYDTVDEAVGDYAGYEIEAQFREMWRGAIRVSPAKEILHRWEKRPDVIDILNLIKYNRLSNQEIIEAGKDIGLKSVDMDVFIKEVEVIYPALRAMAKAIIDQFPDHHIWVAARDGELMYDVLKLIINEDIGPEAANKVQLLQDNSTIQSLLRVKTKAEKLRFLRQYGFNSDVNRDSKVLLLDTGFFGTFAKDMHRLLSEVMGESYDINNFPARVFSTGLVEGPYAQAIDFKLPYDSISLQSYELQRVASIIRAKDSVITDESQKLKYRLAVAMQTFPKFHTRAEYLDKNLYPHTQLRAQDENLTAGFTNDDKVNPLAALLIQHALVEKFINDQAMASKFTKLVERLEQFSFNGVSLKLFDYTRGDSLVSLDIISGGKSAGRLVLEYSWLSNTIDILSIGLNDPDQRGKGFLKALLALFYEIMPDGMTIGFKGIVNQYTLEYWIEKIAEQTRQNARFAQRQSGQYFLKVDEEIKQWNRFGYRFSYFESNSNMFNELNTHIKDYMNQANEYPEQLRALDTIVIESGFGKALVDAKFSNVAVSVNSKQQIILQAQKDRAMKSELDLSNTGGIDLTSDKSFQVMDDGVGGIQFDVDPAMMEQLRNAHGFSPVIINIQPLKDLKAFLSPSTL